MLPTTLLASILLLSVQAYPQVQSARGQQALGNQATIAKFRDPVCAMIAKGTSSSTSVFYPSDIAYDQDMKHRLSSSSQQAKCSVRPGTAEDISIILGIVGSTRTPFAVKGGGHASNPGFSSTRGVHISMSWFSEVTYNPTTETAVVGSGLAWDKVYAALAPFGVNVVGGRKRGVGVAGFTLGGGYSWLTNQYGLTVDTVLAYELVKPTGEIVNVTQESDPALFFGLKGGMNNFGIVTRFTFKTFPQGKVWGGLITYPSYVIADITAATAAFSAQVTDPKAAIITSYTAIPGDRGVSLHLFYDGPTPPAGIFDDFLYIPSNKQNVKTRDFLDLVLVFPSDDTMGLRGIFNGLTFNQYTPKILDAIANETAFWGEGLKSLGVADIDYGVQPFLPTLFSHGDLGSSAYPPVRGKNTVPLNIYYAWTDARFDGVFHEVARLSASRIMAVAMEEGQDVKGAAIYPNYAIFDTPLEALYGHNVPLLQALKRVVDPKDVMGLAGGFKF